MKKKFFIEADIKLQKETEERKKAVAAVIDLPKNADKQPDLLYFSAIFVSAGTNLNGAHFLPSELVASEGTIVSKALDVEHKEEDIIGHIYDRAFIDHEGNKLEPAELANREAASLDTEFAEMHVVIAGVIYKNRFPHIAEEVASNEWKVSMECYYTDFDIKIGDMIMSRREAEVMGLANEDSVVGKMAKVIKKGKELAAGKVERVLRNVMFSGCGIVKNPANPPSVILETANDKGKKHEPKDVIVLDYNKLEEEEEDINLTSNKVEGNTSVITDSNEEEAEMQYNDTVGICVNYKRRVYAGEPQGPDTEVLHEDWCTLYDQECTSYGRRADQPDCLRYKVSAAVREIAEKLMKTRQESDRREELVKKLTDALERASKLD